MAATGTETVRIGMADEDEKFRARRERSELWKQKRRREAQSGGAEESPTPSDIQSPTAVPAPASSPQEIAKVPEKPSTFVPVQVSSSSNGFESKFQPDFLAKTMLMPAISLFKKSGIKQGRAMPKPPTVNLLFQSNDEEEEEESPFYKRMKFALLEDDKPLQQQNSTKQQHHAHESSSHNGGGTVLPISKPDELEEYMEEVLMNVKEIEKQDRQKQAMAESNPEKVVEAAAEDVEVVEVVEQQTDNKDQTMEDELFA